MTIKRGHWGALLGAFLFAGIGGCHSGSNQALVLLEVQIAAAVPPAVRVALSVPAAPSAAPLSVPVLSPQTQELDVGYYMLGENGTITILAQAENSEGCVVGQGMVDTTAEVGKVTAAVVLPVSRAAGASGCTTTDGSASDASARDGAVGDGHPRDGAVGDGHPRDGAVGDGHPRDGAVGDGHPRDGAVGDAHPRDGAGGDAHPRDAAVGDAHPRDASVGDAHPRDSSAGDRAGTGRDASSHPDATDASHSDRPPQVVSAPRLIAPLSTATVTSRRPKLRWTLASGSDGAHVEICRDRACTNVVTAFDASGTSGAPTADLPTGVVFWKAYGRDGGTTGQTSTPTWQFIVGARSAPINNSWGTTLDVNGDGYADVIVGAPGASNNDGRAYLYLGGPSGLPTSPDSTLMAPASMSGGSFGVSIASAGDINGDGFADVIVGAPGLDETTGDVFVYFGSAAGLTADPVELPFADAGDSEFGQVVTGAGDLNGDGYADIFVGTNETTGYVYFGSESGVSPAPAVVLYNNDGFYSAVASSLDVNGDGYSDLVFGELDTGDTFDVGSIYLYLGSATGPPASPNLTLNGPGGSGNYFGEFLSAAGDVNGDGYADVMVGAQNPTTKTGIAYLYLGGPSGLSSAPASTLGGPTTTVFYSVATAGDVNGDGYADVVVGAVASTTGNGSAYLFLGGTSGLPATASQSVNGPSGEFGDAVAGAGDVNGDGHADIVVGTRTAGTDVGDKAYVYDGSSSGLAVPGLTLTYPGGTGGNFGYSIALLRPPSIDADDWDCLASPASATATAGARWSRPLMPNLSISRGYLLPG